MKPRILTIVCLVSMAMIALPQMTRAQDAEACAANVTVQLGDTLSLIAGAQLGDQLAYQSIIDATNAAASADSSYATIANPNQISVGWKLCIPAVAGAQSDAPVVTPEAPPPAPLPTPSTTPVPSPSPTPIAFPTPPALDLALDEMHPLMVEYMRQQQYPGSEIVIEQTLDPGSNYNRYIASYQSDGTQDLCPADRPPRGRSRKRAGP